MATLNYDFDLFKVANKKKPEDRAKLKEIRQEVADFVLEEVLSYVGEGKSPVASGRWKRSLSKDYKDIKSRESGVSYSNMELTGDMLDALETRISGNKISLRISGSEGDKADGHNNFSGRSKLPAREFIPKRGQGLRRDIVNGIKEIIDSHADEG